MDYRPSIFWEERLRAHFTLVGTGRVFFSARYNAWLYRAKLRGLQQVWKTLAITPTAKTILDIGCGTGFFVAYYQDQSCASLTGIDITQISVENLRRRFPLFSFYRGDVGKEWEEPFSPFDIVHVFDVLYHLKTEEHFRKALQNISRLTKPGGYVLMTDYGGEEEKNPAPHVTFHSLSTYKSRLQENGLMLRLVVPLYYLLNRRLFSAFFSQHKTLLARATHRIDEGCALLWYLLDSVLLSHRRANMRLLVAQKIEG